MTRARLAVIGTTTTVVIAETMGLFSQQLHRAERGFSNLHYSRREALVEFSGLLRFISAKINAREKSASGVQMRIPQGVGIFRARSYPRQPAGGPAGFIEWLRIALLALPDGSRDFLARVAISPAMSG